MPAGPSFGTGRRRFDLDERARHLACPRNDPRSHIELWRLCLGIEGIQPHVRQAQGELQLGSLVEKAGHLLDDALDLGAGRQRTRVHFGLVLGANP